jgi:hypothetical protein
MRPDHLALEFLSKLWITLAGDFSIKRLLEGPVRGFLSATA